MKCLILFFFSEEGVVCMEGTANCVLVSCGRLHTCRRLQQCPSCRGDIQQHVQVLNDSDIMKFKNLFMFKRIFSYFDCDLKKGRFSFCIMKSYFC